MATVKLVGKSLIPWLISDWAIHCRIAQCGVGESVGGGDASQIWFGISATAHGFAGMRGDLASQRATINSIFARYLFRIVI